MIFIRKKKKAFVLSPAIFGKKTNEQYERRCEKYGKPQHDSRDGEPQINGYGVANFPDGTSWVVDAKTGETLSYTSSVRYIGVSRGLHFYIHHDHDLLIGDQAIPSFPRGKGEN